MASYNELLALIDAYINQNGVQAITGQVLNGVLRAMVDQLGRGYAIMGAADPTTDPGTPDGPETWFASVPGTYTNFDGIQIVPGELALLSYVPSDGFSKNTIYEGFQTVQATADDNIGYPQVGVSYANGVLSFDFRNIKGEPGENGQDGDPAGFGTVNATVDDQVGTPSVSVSSSGPDTAKNFTFAFRNLKGETGVTSVLATVDNTSGNPQCAVSLNGQQLVLNFTGLKGAQGDTGSSVDYPFTIVNNLTTNDPAQALSAAMGVQLESEVSQLEAEVGEVAIPLIANKTVYLGGTLGATINTTPQTENGWYCSVENCQPGDVFRINGTGGSGTRLWGFVDSNSKLIAVSAASLTGNNLEVVAPAGAAQIVINSHTNSTSYVTSVDSLTMQIAAMNEKFEPMDALPHSAILVGDSTSYIVPSADIVLSQNGDSIEIEFGTINSASLTAGGYAFTKTPTQQSSGQARGFFVADKVAYRGDDGTGMLEGSENVYAGSNSTVKVEYADGNVKFYVNGELKKTYTGQKTVTINSFGNGCGGSYGYWNGQIKSIKVNGSELPWDSFSTGDTASIIMTNGFLTDEQQEQLDSAAEKPVCVVSAVSDKVTVYFKLNSKYYGKLEINHIVNHNDANYSDFWGIENGGTSMGAIATYGNGSFSDISNRLLVGAENEFAIQFYTQDFTGGYHGDERIDIEPGCYVVFIVDGKEYTITDLVSLGAVACSSFGYRQKSALYTMYSETSTHDVLAYHTKRTDFVDGGFVTRNYIEMVSAITCKNVYSGLVCVSKDCADYVINNAGTLFQLSHPDSTAVVSGFANKTSRVVKMYKGGACCHLDSKVIGGNVDAYNDAPINITIDDRKNDGKYYSKMPSNVALSATSVFEFECSVRWDYRAE